MMKRGKSVSNGVRNTRRDALSSSALMRAVGFAGVGWEMQRSMDDERKDGFYGFHGFDDGA